MQFQGLTFFIGFVFILNSQGTFFSPDRNVKLKYCSVEDYLPYDWMNGPGICGDDLDGELECIYATERLTCLRALIDNKIDFMIAEPQDLLILAMNSFDENILVAGERKELEMKNDKGEFSMVVLFKGDQKNLSDVGHLRYCTPGFYQLLSSQNYVKYFENKLIPAGKCNPNQTVLENRMSDLSKRFESVCISGTLSRDAKFSEKLSLNYSNVDSSCQTVSGRERIGAGLCFFYDHGNLAWLDLKIADVLVKLLGHTGHEFQFYCPNGTMTDEPCIWLNVPFQTIITKKNMAERVIETMNYLYISFNIPKSSDYVPYELDKFKTPTDYLQDSYPEYFSIENHMKCGKERVVNWCVVTQLEMDKCWWISYSAQTHEIEPLINCVLETSKEKCIESVKHGWSDIFAIKPELLSEAKQAGLKPLLHMASNVMIGMNDTAAIVHKSSKINSLQALRNAKACFVDYKDYGWNTFIYLMMNMTGDKNWLCQDKLMVSDFFQEICVFDLDQKNETFPNKLHSLCSKISENMEYTNSTCTDDAWVNRNIGNYKHFSQSKSDCITVDQELLSCLSEDGADVVFVNLSSLYHNHYKPFKGNYKILCLNGSISNSNAEPRDCYAHWSNHGSLVVRDNMTRTREDEIYLLMIELDTLFGKRLKPNIRLMHLYGSFDGQSGVIFPEGTEALTPECTLRCSLDYQEIIEHVTTNIKSCGKFQSRRLKHLTVFLFFILGIAVGVLSYMAVKNFETIRDRLRGILSQVF